jgi:hypothetical protein
MKRTIVPGVIIVALIVVFYFSYKGQRKEMEVQKFYDSYTEERVKKQYRIVMQKAVGTPFNIDSLRSVLYDSTKNNVQRLVILGKADSIVSKMK